MSLSSYKSDGIITLHTPTDPTCHLDSGTTSLVTNPPCPSRKQTDADKINALKRRTRDFMGQQRSSDNDVQTSYLESADNYKYDTLAIARLIAR
jgi:hypothetical protein